MNRWLLASLALTLLVLGGTLLVYQKFADRLPDQVPTHWDLHFNPDKFTPRGEILPTLLLGPGVMAALCLLTVVLPWLSPRPFTVETFRQTYNYLMFLVTVLFAWIQCVLLLSYFQVPGVNLGRWLVAGLLFMFGLIGNVLGRVRRNFYMGVRTPWTIADEGVWNRTHRLTAWLYTAVGFAGCAAVLAGAPLMWTFVVFITLVLVPVPYSFVIYKRLEKQGKLSAAARDASTTGDLA
jgi:uncharacterized membrane protein